jgi:hypothetical protein
MTKSTARTYSQNHNFITVLAGAALLINIAEFVSNLQRPLQASSIADGLAPLFIWLCTALFCVIVALAGIVSTQAGATNRKVKKQSFRSDTYYMLFFLIVLISPALPMVTL